MVALRLPTQREIKQLRKTAGLTQKELARRADVSQSLIARIETGTVDPRLSTLKKIVEAIATTQEGRAARDIMHSPVITINAMEPVYKAIRLMRKHGISQIPVVKKDAIVGSVQESTLIEKIAYRREQRNIVYEPVQNIMEDRFTVVSPSTNLEDVLAILSRGQPAVLVMDHEKLVGVITKIDVISFTLHTKK